MRELTGEAYRHTVQACRDGARKTKAHSELTLARDKKGKKKGFYRPVRCSRTMKGISLSRVGDLVTGNREKAEVLGAFLPSVFTGKTGLQQSQIPETRENVWSKDDLPLVREDQFREHLNKPYTHTDPRALMGP